MTRVAISPTVLQWALDRSRLSLDDLTSRFPKIKQWAVGKQHPTLRQLEVLARVTSTPFGFFFLPEPPEEQLPVPYFRTLSDEAQERPSPDLIDSIQMMQKRQGWMREFLIDEGYEPLPFVESVRISDRHINIADRIRNALNFDELWASRHRTWTDALDALKEAIDGIGILVVTNGIVGNNTHRKLDVEEFRGFVLVDKYAPLVFVNGADGKAAQMFTLAHELAHVFLGSSAAFDLRQLMPAPDDTELACNAIAAELLVPEQQLRSIWSSFSEQPGRYQDIARQFKVSQIVAARRLLDLNLIDKQEFLEFYRSYQKEERQAIEHRSPGGDFYATQNSRIGPRFASAVVRAVNEGRVLYSEAYRLTGLHGKTFEAYAASLGLRGPKR
ncbi:MAG: ImmA/IrrE family metallo-endopeptidase [Sedimentisphaerales bacterium]|nr:ImmA/IrrE family metallo-endopeptidase [Sedimentisphaerales bacterium]